MASTPLTAEERTECQAVFEAMDEEQAHRAVRRLIAQDRAARPGPSEFARAARLPADVARDWSSVLPQPGGAQTPTATDQNSSPEARGLVVPTHHIGDSLLIGARPPSAWWRRRVL